MQILTIADRPPKQPIQEIIQNNDINLIITLGDLDQFEINEIRNVTNIPKIGVYGNHCSGTYFEPLGITNIHLQTIEINGIVFESFEGSVKYKESKYSKMYIQEQASELLKDFLKVDVMIVHSPPFCINDEPDEISHQGFKALTKYIEEKHPKHFLYCHTYPIENKLTTNFLKKIIHYIYEDKIISF